MRRCARTETAVLNDIRDTVTPARARVAIALCSAAVILLQITVTRILSVVVWYHWAFFSISLAMLGVGAPGAWFALRRTRSPRTLRALLVAAAILVPAAIVAIVKASHLFGGSTILFCLACLLPPVLCLGAAVCLLLLGAEGPAIGRMYAADLLGAFAGALAVIPLMWLVPTPMLAAGLGLLPLLAWVLLGGSRGLAAALVVALAGLLAWREPLTLRHGKSYAETGSTTRPIHEKWTPTARITVFDNIFFQDPELAFGWGLGTVPPPGPAPEQYWIEQDGSAGTPITRFDGDLGKLGYLLHDVTSAGYQLRPPRSAAIVGAGGGRDILTALVAGTQSVTAIELNPAIVSVLRGRFGDFSGHVYDDPRVHAVVGEGRSALTHSDERFDLIQISLIDSWAATAAGAYSLSENNLYTVEAFRLYWSRLNDDGLVSVSRWMMGGFGLELPRLVFVVKSALQAEGVADPLAHVVVLQGARVGTVLVLKSPLTPEEAERLRGIAAARGFTLHLPETSLPVKDRWLRWVWDQGPAAYAKLGLHLDEVTDDRPFFFQVLSPLRPIRREAVEENGPNAEGVVVLQRLMMVMAALTLVTFFAPFALGRWLRPEPGLWRGSAYFTGIGLAFMLVEVAWLQRFILYLGHPSLATTVALGSMLLGAGAGSFASARVATERAQRLGFLAAALILLTNLVLAPVFAATLGWPWPVRLLVSVALIAPSGFLMGFGFPLGMRRFGTGNGAWFWALNGAAGVLASVLSLALSMELGFVSVAAIGALLYLLCWVLLREPGPSQRGEASASPT